MRREDATGSLAREAYQGLEIYRAVRLSLILLVLCIAVATVIILITRQNPL